MTNNRLKLAIGTVAFALWAWFLLSVYFNPTEVPAWAQERGAPRKILLLDTSFMPTIFTLYMGVVACILTLVGAYRLLSSLVRTERHSPDTADAFAVMSQETRSANRAPIVDTPNPQPVMPVFGRRTERPPVDIMQHLHDLDAYATWQGGFAYYFDHVDEDDWQKALQGLENYRLHTSANAFSEARRMFEAQPDEGFEGKAAEEYFAIMDTYDKRWRSEVPTLHKILVDWRKDRGLEEFGLPGW